jgi:hypothetical protein
MVERMATRKIKGGVRMKRLILIGMVWVLLAVSAYAQCTGGTKCITTTHPDGTTSTHCWFECD